MVEGDRPTLVLASASPQRSEILSRLKIDFTVHPSGAVELTEGDPREVAMANALAKARTVRSREAPGALILGADTLLDVDGVIYGKPPDAVSARRMLGALAGRTHRVLGGVAVVRDTVEAATVDVTAVTFRTVPGARLDRYVATGEWRGRAGGYAIQGQGAALIAQIEGNYENVVGLSVVALSELLPDLL